MKNLTRLISIFCVVVMVLSCPFAVAAESDSYTLPALATQMRRMWCQTNYTYQDYVYSTEMALSWGRVLYTRFYDTKEVSVDEINRAVLNFEVFGTKPNEELRYAVLALENDVATKVETSVTVNYPNLKHTGDTGTGNHLMINDEGFYLPEVADSVVAYVRTKTDIAPTAQDTLTEGTANYIYPAEVTLDVTNAVKAARQNGRNVQFVIIAAKDIFAGEQNIGRLGDFGRYENGTVYDNVDNVLLENVPSASLDTSQSVCGTAGYYTTGKTTDDYFYWSYLPEQSIKLTIDKKSNQEIYEDYCDRVTSPETAAEHFDYIARLLDEQYVFYFKEQQLVDSSASERLFELTQIADFDEFYTAFNQAVKDLCWQGYEAGMIIESDLGGLRGKLRLEGKRVPDFCYVQLEAWSADKLEFTETLTFSDFTEYNVYDKRDGIVSLKLTATADEAGKKPITATKTVNVTGIMLPEVFITELSNQHTITYFDDSKGANRGQHHQKFQYVELYNYTDKTVDLAEYRFVYNDHKGSHTFEWILEEDGSLLLKPGEVYVIGVYSDRSATDGYKYDTDSSIKDYWNGFNSFYNCNIPATNRVMVACVASGQPKVMLDGIGQLTRSADAKVTCSAQIKKGETVITEVSLFENRPATSYAFYFAPAENGGVQERFLFVAACFPGSLLKEQQFSYCEKPFLNATPVLKVSSYNILATEKSASDNYSNYEIEQREDLFVEYMEKYDVDIVGMQEVNYRWIKLLKEDMARLGYSCVQGISTNGHTYANASGTWDLMNPIYYKTDKFTQLESGHGFLTENFPQNGAQWDSSNMKRTMTWVTLQDNKTGEVVSFVNTHLVLSGKQARVEQVKLMYRKGEELQKKYGGGIVITGDHNMAENSEPYQAYINSGLVVDTKYATTNHNSISTCSVGGVNHDEKYGTAIDYVMVSKNYVVNQYYVHNGVDEIGHLSDHAGLYVELFNGDYSDTDVPTITGVTDGGSYCSGTLDIAVTDQYLDQVLLNGEPVEDPAAIHLENLSETPVSFTLTATDKAGREVSATFALSTHRYGDWIITEFPTCSKAGTRASTCTNCGDAHTLPIPATNKHTAGDWVTDKNPTCTKAGEAHKECIHCGATLETTTLKKEGHDKGKWTTVKQPTATADGKQECRCTKCGTLLNSKAIAKTGKNVVTVFKDLKKSDWYVKNGAIDFVYNQGLFSGLNATTFGPKENMTRAMFVTVLGRLHGVKSTKATTKFTDVKKSAYYSGYVAWANKNGIVSGLTATTFGPDNNINREQICTMMVRYCDFANIKLKKINKAVTFIDAKEISSYAKKAVTACQTGGIVGGEKAGSGYRFRPKGNATRAEVATIMMQFYNTYVK